MIMIMIIMMYKSNQLSRALKSSVNVLDNFVVVVVVVYLLAIYDNNNNNKDIS